MTCRKRVDGKFVGPDGFSIPASQALCSGLLEECFEIMQEIKARSEDDVPSSLKPILDRLQEIRSQLESLVMTHRWTLRETDLWNYSMSLQEIDKMRVDGKFVDSEGNRPEGQYVGDPVPSFDEVGLIDNSCVGSVVPFETMLWVDLPAAFVE